MVINQQLNLNKKTPQNTNSVGFKNATTFSVVAKFYRLLISLLIFANESVYPIPNIPLSKEDLEYKYEM